MWDRVFFYAVLMCYSLVIVCSSKCQHGHRIKQTFEFFEYPLRTGDTIEKSVALFRINADVNAAFTIFRLNLRDEI